MSELSPEGNKELLMNAEQGRDLSRITGSFIPLLPNDCSSVSLPFSYNIASTEYLSPFVHSQTFFSLLPNS